MRAIFTFLVCAVVLLAPAGKITSQDKPASVFVDVAALDKAVNDGLRDVINLGAKVFNEQGDYHGCVRLYQGGLLAVKPLLAHRPELQKAVDEGLAKSNEVPRAVDRAFALRKLIDDIRSTIRGAAPPPEKTEEPPKKGPAKVVEPKKDPPEPVKPKVEPKKVTPEPIKEKVEPKKVTPEPAKEKVEPKKVTPEFKKDKVEPKEAIQGSVRFLKKPVTSGYIVFAEKKTNQTFSTYLRPDGTFRFRTEIPPGSYAVYFEAAPTEPGVAAVPLEVPQMYGSLATTPLAAEVRPGQNAFVFLLLGKGL